MSAAEHPRTAVPGQAKANTNTNTHTKSKPPAEAKGNRKGRAKEKTQGKTTAQTVGPARAGRGGAARQAALGSAERRAAVVLEVLAGVRTVPQAAEALGVSVNYYYLLERRALAGLVAGCAPRPRGKPGASAERQVARLEKQLARCQQECQRQTALVRAAERACGLRGLTASSAATSTRRATAAGAARPAAANQSGKRRRARRPTVRALRAAALLHRADAESSPPSDPPPPDPSPPGSPGKNSSWSAVAPQLEPELDAGPAEPGSAADADAARREWKTASGVAPDEESSDGAHRMQTAGGRTCGSLAWFGVGPATASDDPADAQRRADD